MTKEEREQVEKFVDMLLADGRPDFIDNAIQVCPDPLVFLDLAELPTDSRVTQATYTVVSFSAWKKDLTETDTSTVEFIAEVEKYLAFHHVPLVIGYKDESLLVPIERIMLNSGGSA